MKYYYLLSLLILSCPVFAQEGPNFYDRYNQENMISISKMNDNLSKSELSYTGLTDIALPVYTVEADGVEIPIILRYNPNSTRVNDRSGWVGFGWDLDIGGTVTRSVNGTPDDVVITAKMGLVADTPHAARIVNPLRGYGISGAKRIKNYNWQADLNTPFERKSMFLKLGNVTNKFYKKILYDAVAPNMLFFDGGIGYDWNEYNNEGIDTEPDVFYYRLFDRSGKFVFHYSAPTQQIKPVTIPYDNVAITWDIDAATQYYNQDDITNKYNLRYPFQTGGAQAFDIRDDKGNRYSFSVLDSSYLTNVQQQTSWHIGCGRAFYSVNVPGSNNFVVKYNHAWHIRNLLTANGRTINFNYQKDTSFIFSSFRKMANSDISATNSNTFVPVLKQDASINVTAQVNNKIKTIETDNEIIEFVLSNTKRLDVTSSRQLDKIIIYRKTFNGAVEFKRIEFSYDYFTTAQGITYPVVSYIASPFGVSPVQHDNYDKKLKLTGIRIKSGSEVMPYNFTYEESGSLPRIGSVKQDLYGFFNGSLNENYYLYPKLYIYPNKQGIDRYTINRRSDWVSAGETEYTLDGMDRSSSWLMTRGTLKRINTPLGGFVDFTFEPNQYFWQYTNIIGGGMRIKRIETNAGSGAPSIFRDFTYGRSDNVSRSSGKLLQYPIVAYGENHCGFEGESLTPASFSRNSLDYIKRFTWRLENPKFNELIDNGSPSVGYEEITETHNIAGKTVYSYWVPREAGQENIEPAYTQQSTGIEAFNSIHPLSRITHGGCYWEPSSPEFARPIILDVFTTLDLDGVDYTPNSYYGGAKVNLDWARGMPSGKKSYNVNSALVYEELYKYKLFSPAIAYVPSLNQGTTRVYNTTYYSGNFDNAFSKNNLYFTYSEQVANVKMVLQSIEKKDYGTGGNAGPTVVSTTYEYPNTNPANLDPYPRKISTINSNGNITSTRFKYPRDYPVSPGTSPGLNGIPQLLAANNFKSVIETWNEVFKSATGTTETMSATLNEYRTFSEAPAAGPRQSKVFMLPTNVPLSNFTPSAVSGSSFTKDSRYVTEVEVSRIDYRGNPLQVYSLQARKPESSIMDGKALRKIAVAENALRTEIAFSSFEESPYPALGTIDDSKGNWEFDQEYISIDPSSPTGTYCLGLYAEDGNIINTANSSMESTIALASGRTYTLSYWIKNTTGPVTVPRIYNGTVQLFGATLKQQANGWKRYELIVTGTGARLKFNLPMPATIGIIHGLLIDEVRLYPVNTRMQTFTYDHKLNTPSSSTDAAGRTTYFEYDDLGRVILKKDQNRNVLEGYTYRTQSTQ